MFVVHVCQILPLHLHHTRTHCPKTARVRQAVPSVTSGFGTGLWHVQQVSAECVYTALLIDSLSLSQRKLAGQERQRCTFDCVHLVHIRVGVIGLCRPGEKWLVLSSVLGLSDTITGLRTEPCNRGY